MRTTTIENKILRITLKHVGAELSGLLDKRDGIEHMWRADPKFWPRHAPNLFPCIGESKDGKVNVDGSDYPMGRHGFARHELFAVVGQSKQHVEFELRSDPNTLRQFPFDFVFRVRYELEGSTLKQTFEVTNSGINEMGFQVGGHPAFAVPFRQGEAYNDYEVWFESSLSLDRWLLTKEGLYSGQTRPFLNNEAQFGLFYDLFKEDALVFKNIPSKEVWIQHRDGGKRLKMNYAGFPHLGIWSIPGADYVCLEPWVGCADDAAQAEDFFLKDSLITLKPNEVYGASFSISLEN
jgi:galactose mutarotase-like enzyme